MEKILLSFVLVLLTIYLVPFLVYGLGAALAGLRTPAGVSPRQFLHGVLVSKVGTALAFVLIFQLAHSVLAGQWLLYAGAWWLMFVFGEIGQAIGPNYGWKAAVAGVISESIYLPLSAWMVDRLLG